MAMINMLHNVIYDRKNMQYDQLVAHVIDNQCLVTCCIDAHFTAFQVLSSRCLLYYDPQNASVMMARTERDVHTTAVYLLMKCNYGDNNHIIENEKYYKNGTSSLLRTM